MSIIEPHRSWLALESHLEKVTSPAARNLVTQVRDHMEYEIKGELEPLMNTLTAEPVYHFWSQGMVLEGREAVHGFYTNLIASGANQFEVVIDTVVADDHHVVTEGQVRQVYTGKELKGMGRTEVDGKPVEDSDLFMTTTQLVTVWPGASDGKLVGEDIYFGGDPFSSLVRLSPDDLPEYYEWRSRT